MNIKSDIYLNQLSQNIVSQQEGCSWFNELDKDTQLKVLRRIMFFIMQSGARGKDAKAAITESQLKPTYTSCQLLLKAYENEPEGNKLLSIQLSKVINLPENERCKSFLLLLNLFKIADKNKRKKGLSPDKYWWHHDLSSNEVISKILSEFIDKI